MSLASKTKDIINHFGFKFSKSLGQNFLIDQNILDKIVGAAELNNESCVIEIGPGIGTMTQEVAKFARKVVAIELDDTLIPVLNETLGNYNNIKVIHNDALKVNFKRLIEEENLTEVKVVANLPYYVTTPIISKLLTEKPGLRAIIIMIQREVADRMVAKPGSKEYGALSLLVQYYTKVEKITRVPPACFIPQPKVESAVIKMTILEEPAVKVNDEKLFFKIIRDSFNMRRKTLWNVLKQTGLSQEKLEKVFSDSGIDPKRRGETLTIEEFAKLSDRVRDNM